MTDHNPNLAVWAMSECTCGKCAAQPALSAEAVALLERHHSFPGPYMFKVIGFEAPSYVDDVRRAVEGVLGPLGEEGQVRCRPSSGGKYVAVTLEVLVRDSGQVLAVYAALRGVSGVVALV